MRTSSTLGWVVAAALGGALCVLWIGRAPAEVPAALPKAVAIRPYRPAVWSPSAPVALVRAYSSPVLATVDPSTQDTTVWYLDAGVPDSTVSAYLYEEYGYYPEGDAYYQDAYAYSDGYTETYSETYTDLYSERYVEYYTETYTEYYSDYSSGYYATFYDGGSGYYWEGYGGGYGGGCTYADGDDGGCGHTGGFDWSGSGGSSGGGCGGGTGGNAGDAGGGEIGGWVAHVPVPDRDVTVRPHTGTTVAWNPDAVIVPHHDPNWKPGVVRNDDVPVQFASQDVPTRTFTTTRNDPPTSVSAVKSPVVHPVEPAPSASPMVQVRPTTPREDVHSSLSASATSSPVPALSTNVPQVRPGTQPVKMASASSRPVAMGAETVTRGNDTQVREQEEKVRIARENAEREDRDRAAREQAERDRIARENAEREARDRAAREQAERDRIARENAEREARDRAAREQAERDRIERERAAQPAVRTAKGG